MFPTFGSPPYNMANCMICFWAFWLGKTWQTCMVPNKIRFFWLGKVMGFQIIFPDLNSPGVKVPYDPRIDDWRDFGSPMAYWTSDGFQTSSGYVGLLSSLLQRIAWAPVPSDCFRYGKIYEKELHNHPKRILVHCSCVLFSPHLGDL